MVFEEVKKVVGNAVTQSTKENTQQCKKKPMKCLRQIVFDGIVIVVLYSLLTRVVDSVTPNIDDILGFLAMWTSIMFLLKNLDIDNADQFYRVAFFSIASKVFGILTVGA
jgi:hypothetical protein